MSESVAIIIAAVITLVQVLLLAAFSFLWAEIVRIRDRLHKLEPTNDSIERLIAALRK